MDPMKVECIKFWKIPASLKDIQAFLSFAKFYRPFIKGFSSIARPPIKLKKICHGNGLAVVIMHSRH